MRSTYSFVLLGFIELVYLSNGLVVDHVSQRLTKFDREQVCVVGFNHQSRGHMSADLHRYIYAACFAEANGVSPVLKDFPKELWPKHKNVKAAVNGSLFADRFRVQKKRPFIGYDLQKRAN